MTDEILVTPLDLTVQGSWVLYDQGTGRIRATFSGEVGTLLINVGENEGVAEGEARPDLDYVLAGAVEPRPDFPVAVPELTVGVPAVLQVPPGTRVWANGEDQGVVEGETLELITDEAAAHALRLVCWPYLNYQGIVTVTPL